MRFGRAAIIGQFAQAGLSQIIGVQVLRFRYRPRIIENVLNGAVTLVDIAGKHRVLDGQVRPSRPRIEDIQAAAAPFFAAGVGTVFGDRHMRQRQAVAIAPFKGDAAAEFGRAVVRDRGVDDGQVDVIAVDAATIVVGDVARDGGLPDGQPVGLVGDAAAIVFCGIVGDRGVNDVGGAALPEQAAAVALIGSVIGYDGAGDRQHDAISVRRYTTAVVIGFVPGDPAVRERHDGPSVNPDAATVVAGEVAAHFGIQKRYDGILADPDTAAVATGFAAGDDQALENHLGIVEDVEDTAGAIAVVVADDRHAVDAAKDADVATKDVDIRVPEIVFERTEESVVELDLVDPVKGDADLIGIGRQGDGVVDRFTQRCFAIRRIDRIGPDRHDRRPLFGDVETDGVGVGFRRRRVVGGRDLDGPGPADRTVRRGVGDPDAVERFVDPVKRTLEGQNGAAGALDGDAIGQRGATVPEVQGAVGRRQLNLVATLAVVIAISDLKGIAIAGRKYGRRTLGDLVDEGYDVDGRLRRRHDRLAEIQRVIAAPEAAPRCIVYAQEVDTGRDRRKAQLRIISEPPNISYRSNIDERVIIVSQRAAILVKEFKVGIHPIRVAGPARAAVNIGIQGLPGIQRNLEPVGIPVRRQLAFDLHRRQRRLLVLKLGVGRVEAAVGDILGTARIIVDLRLVDLLQHPVEGGLRVLIEGQLRLDVAGLAFQVPVAALIGRTGIVGGCRHIGIGGVGQGRYEGLAHIPGGHVATVEQDVAVGRQGVADGGQLGAAGVDGGKIQGHPA